MLEVKGRNQIEDKYKWDIDTLYNGKDDILKEKNKIEKLLDEILELKGKLMDSGESLYKALATSDEIEKLLGRILVYTFMKRDEDNGNPKGQILSGLGEKINVEISSKLSFIVPEILEAEDEKILSLINECKELKLYENFLKELIRKRKIVLSENEEKILTEVGEISSSFENIYKMLSYVDLKYPNIKDGNGKEYELNDSNYSSFVRSEDRVLRKNAFIGMLSTYESFKNTYGSILGSSIKKDVFYSKTRGFESSLEASLFDDKIPSSVYENVIKAATNGIGVLDEFIEIKRRELNLDEIHLYDLYAPTVKEVDMEVDYEKAKDMIKSSLSILGDDYIEILDEAFNNRWIDVYYNKGKYTGAYSWGSYDTKPYILLNYKNKLDDVLTLAHELGHSIHSYYSRKNQPYVYSSYTIFCAEVASITNECLMYLYLMDNLKGGERKYIIDQFLETIRTTFFRQTMFAEFEKITHEKCEEGEILNGDELSKVWEDIYKKYYGNSCVIDEEIYLEWARIPHFFDSFYVYKYVTGLAAGISMAKSIIDNKDNLKKYLDFLKSGGSDYSIELLKKAGVDFETTKPLDDTMEMFKYLLEEYKNS